MRPTSEPPNCESKDYVFALGVQLWISCMGRHPHSWYHHSSKETVDTMGLNPFLVFIPPLKKTVVTELAEVWLSTS